MIFLHRILLLVFAALLHTLTPIFAGSFYHEIGCDVPIERVYTSDPSWVGMVDTKSQKRYSLRLARKEDERLISHILESYKITSDPANSAKRMCQSYDLIKTQKNPFNIPALDFVIADSENNAIGFIELHPYQPSLTVLNKSMSKINSDLFYQAVCLSEHTKQDDVLLSDTFSDEHFRYLQSKYKIPESHTKEKMEIGLQETRREIEVEMKLSNQLFSITLDSFGKVLQQGFQEDEKIDENFPAFGSHKELTSFVEKKTSTMGAEISWYLNPNYMGRGIGSASLKVLRDHLKTESTLRFLTASVLAQNTASWKGLEKAGFKKFQTNRYEDGLAYTLVLDF
jgi:hypothetical protein